eukprot:11446742-Heterocapsa_arctica.AAC.1
MVPGAGGQAAALGEGVRRGAREAGLRGRPAARLAPLPRPALRLAGGLPTGELRRHPRDDPAHPL